MQRPGGAPIAPTGPNLTIAVTGQVEQVGVGPTGRLVDGMVVSFRTPSGVNSSVFVPKSEYTARNVQAAVQAHAAELEAVAKLGK